MNQLQEQFLQIGQTEYVGVRISKDEKNLIDRYAKEKNMSRTTVVRLALSNFFNLSNEEVEKMQNERS